MAQYPQTARIMIVDDEVTARTSLAEVLRLEGYEVTTAASGEEALRRLADESPCDLMVLDLKMPGMNGLQVTDAVQKRWPDMVIILLTAYGTLDTAIQAIRRGAHDYLLKPAQVPEILESVRRGLAKRRREQHRRQLVSRLERTLSELATVEGRATVGDVSPLPPARFLQCRDLLLDRQKHVATLRGEHLDLTPTEFRLLACLMENPDQICSPQELVRRAQGYDADAWGARAIVRVHIRRLRKKLEPDPSHPQYIINVRGVGYMFASSGPEPT